MNDDWLTLREVAERLRVAPRTLYAWREEGGGPPGFLVGRRLLFEPAEVDAWVRARAGAPAGQPAVAAS